MNSILKKISLEALILAGGEGRRLGGIDKGLVAVNNKPLVEHVASPFTDNNIPVSLVANRSLNTYGQLFTHVLTDHDTAFLGPLAGIAAHAPQVSAEWVAIVACDLIFLPHNWFNLMLDQALAGQCRLVCAQDAASGTVALCAVAHRSTLASAQTLLASGEHRWRAWLEHNRANTRQFPPLELFNINTEDDLRYARCRF